MDLYVVWCDLAPGVKDLEFCDAVDAMMGHLIVHGSLKKYRVVRRKFGFGPEGMGEFCITMEFEHLADLDSSFGVISTRDGEIERLHGGVFSRVVNFKSALYRDFPDANRVRS